MFSGFCNVTSADFVQKRYLKSTGFLAFEMRIWEYEVHPPVYYLLYYDYINMYVCMYCKLSYQVVILHSHIPTSARLQLLKALYVYCL